MDHNHRRRWVVLLAPSLIVAASACDGPPSVTSSTSQATVKGTVTVNGKLANTGTVVFDGANQSRPTIAPVRAEIGKDGSYEAKPYVGLNRVTLAGSGLIKQVPTLAYERMNFDVKDGENTFAIEVPKNK